MSERETGLGILLGLGAILALVVLDPRRAPPLPPLPPASLTLTPSPSPSPSPTPSRVPEPASPSPPAPAPTPSPTPKPSWTLAPGASVHGQRLWEALQWWSRAAGVDLARGGLAGREETLETRRDLARRVAEGELDLAVFTVLDTWTAWSEAKGFSPLAPWPPPPPEPLPEAGLAALAREELAALVARDREFEALLGNKLVRGLQAERADADFLERYRRNAHGLETRWRNTLSGWLVDVHRGVGDAVVVLAQFEGPLATQALAEARERLRDEEISSRTREAWLAALGRDLDGRHPPCADRLGALRELGFGGDADAAAHAAGLFLRLSAGCPEGVQAGDAGTLLAALGRAAEAPASRRDWLVRGRMGDFGEGTAALMLALEGLETPSPRPATAPTTGLPPPRLGF